MARSGQQTKPPLNTIQIDENLPIEEIAKQLKSIIDGSTPQAGGTLISIGPVSLQWVPELQEGVIDVSPIAAEGRGPTAIARLLKSKFDKVRSALPKNTLWGLNANADGKHKIYSIWFDGDEEIRLNQPNDPWFQKKGNPGFTLRVAEDLSSMNSRTAATQYAKRNGLKYYMWEGKLFEPDGQATNAAWRNIRGRRKSEQVGGSRHASKVIRAARRARNMKITPGAEEERFWKQVEVDQMRAGTWDVDSPTGFEDVQLEHVRQVARTPEGTVIKSDDPENVKPNPKVNAEGSGWQRKNILEQKRDASNLDFEIGIDENTNKLRAVRNYDELLRWSEQGIEIEPGEDLDAAIQRVRRELYSETLPNATQRQLNGSQEQNTLKFDEGEGEAKVNPDGTITLDKPNIGQKVLTRARDVLNPRNMFFDMGLNSNITRQLGLLAGGKDADWGTVGREAAWELGASSLLGGVMSRIPSPVAIPFVAKAAYDATDSFVEGATGKGLTERQANFLYMDKKVDEETGAVSYEKKPEVEERKWSAVKSYLENRNK